MTVYRHPLLYRFAMAGLYGRQLRERDRAIAAEIPNRAEVLDVCSGDCLLYLRCLRHQNVHYTGLDASGPLVRWAQGRGVNVKLFDLAKEDLPTADIVVMQASLYQFLPHARDVLRRLIAAARRKVIVSEPVRNLASSTWAPLASAARWLTRPDGSQPYLGERFDADSLAHLFRSQQGFLSSYPIAGGREVVGVFRGTAP